MPDVVFASRRYSGILGIRRELWLLVGYGLLNLAILLLLQPAPNSDWATSWWRVESWGSGVYDHPWRYSPVLLPLVPVLVAVGPWVLAGAQVAAVATLVRVGFWPFWLFAFSAFFWVDLLVGNVFTFVAVAAAWALTGSRAGSLVFLLLTILMPRPVQLPLAIWLLWRMPEVRGPFLLIFVVHAIAALASGFALPWIESFPGSAAMTSEPYVIGPGRVFGLAWLLVGIPLAALMVWRGSGPLASLAGLAASPFLLPQYLLMGVIAMPSLLRLQRPGSSMLDVHGDPSRRLKSPGAGVR